MKAKGPDGYDPLDFHTAVCQLDDAARKGDLLDRKFLLKSLLGFIGRIEGRQEFDLFDYLTELSLFDEVPVDADRIHDDHYEFLIHYSRQFMFKDSRQWEKRVIGGEKRAEQLKINKESDKGVLKYIHDKMLTDDEQNEGLLITDWTERFSEVSSKKSKPSLVTMETWLTELGYKFKKRVRGRPKKKIS